LPGVEEKDIEVTMLGDRLTIKGEKKSEHEEQQDQNGRVVHRMEGSYGSFQRTMTMPYAVDPGEVSADFKDGRSEDPASKARGCAAPDRGAQDRNQTRQ
jgi:HSP20 family protein